MAIPDLSETPLESLVSLKGRGAVVTGGAKGLGEAIARRLAEAGADVMLGDVDEDEAQATASRIAERFGTRVVAMRLDVRDSASISAIADAAVTAFGRLDIWVNNAGVFPFSPVLEMTDEDWDGVLNVNLRGTFIGCREAARRMVHAGHAGVIVNIASTTAFRGSGSPIAHYVASKHGVRGITTQMARELAGQGIRVLAVAPTSVVTPGVEEKIAEVSATREEVINQNLNGPLGRAGVPDDIARVVLFCVSDQSLFMTGSTLLADQGAMTLG